MADLYLCEEEPRTDLTVRKLIWLIAFLWAAAFAAMGQHRLEGTVVDAESKNPIPFASIGVKGTSRGTSSNIDGQFSLLINPTDSLIVSCVGYATRRVSGAHPLSVIELSPVAMYLDGLIVTTKPIDARKLVRQAFSSVKENYNTSPFMQRFFYRHYCTDNGVYGRLIEAAIDVWKDEGYKSVQQAVGNKDQIRVTQLRRSLDKTRSARGHDPIAIGEILESDIIGYQEDPKQEHMNFYSNVSDIRFNLEHYSFSLKGTTSYEGHEIYKVAFASNPDSSLTNTGAYHSWGRVEGMLFITVDDHAIVKAEVNKYYEHNSKHGTVYYTNFNGKRYPYHFVLDGDHRDDVYGEHRYHIELMATEIITDRAAKFTGHVPGRQELLQIPYDSLFWSTSTVLKATPLEEGIVRDLGGGASLTRQFQLYRQYESNLLDGGHDGEKKFKWLCDFNKGRGLVYVIFWGGDCRPYLHELELAKQLSRKYGNSVTFVLLSLEDEDSVWQQLVQRYVLFADGIVNYRIGSNSRLADAWKVNRVPTFLLLDRSGKPVSTPTKRPSDPHLVDDLNILTAGIN